MVVRLNVGTCNRHAHSRNANTHLCIVISRQNLNHSLTYFTRFLTNNASNFVPIRFEIKRARTWSSWS